MFYLRSFFLLQALFTIFIAGGLFFKDSGIKTKTISIYAGLFGLEILIFLFGTSRLVELYPNFFFRGYFTLGLLYGPLLYLHFKTIILKKKRLEFIDALHLIPLILANIYIFDITIILGPERIQVIQDNFNGRVMTLNYIRATHLLIYGIIALYIFVKNKAKLSTNAVFYLGGISILYVIATLVIAFYTLFANSWRDFSYYYIFSNTIMFVIAYILYKNPKFFQVIKKKYQNSKLDTKSMLAIKTNIDTLLKDEQLYLNKNMSIDLLASKLNERSHHISQTFSDYIQQNFNDYINSRRIEHAKKLLHDTSYNRYKIEAIANESGFNNKVTFYSAFSKFEGTTPAKFRKAIKS